MPLLPSTQGWTTRARGIPRPGTMVKKWILLKIMPMSVGVVSTPAPCQTGPRAGHRDKDHVGPMGNTGDNRATAMR